VLLRAVQANQAQAGGVDGAIQRLFEARAQLQSADREMFQAIAKDLSPEKRARAALFLGRFQDRIDRKAIMFMHERGPGKPGSHGGMMGARSGRHAMRMEVPGPDQDRLMLCLGEGCADDEDEELP
jgi:hypothetical protein